MADDLRTRIEATIQDHCGMGSVAIHQGAADAVLAEVRAELLAIADEYDQLYGGILLPADAVRDAADRIVPEVNHG